MEEEETKPTLESRVIVALVIIFIAVIAVLITNAVVKTPPKNSKITVACIY